jgi:hypothetical protein
MTKFGNSNFFFLIHSCDTIISKGVSMIRVNFGPILETVYIDIILNKIIER